MACSARAPSNPSAPTTTVTPPAPSSPPAPPAPPPLTTMRDLMPQPFRVTSSDGRYLVRDGLAVFGDPRLRPQLERLVARWRIETGVPAAIVADPARADVVVEAAGSGRAVPSLGDDESYLLAVTATGVRLSAAAPVGIVRATETLVQLFDGAQRALPIVEIEDHPRLPWRGLLIDASRHFLPVPTVERILEAMAVVKMNVLHLHLSDEPGFRAESLVHPRLHQLGSNGQYYSQAELRHLVEYAAERGIRVLPEFDMPGHVTSWLVGYPELGSLPGPYQVATTFGWRDPAFDPTRQEVYDFIASFIDEMAPLFPDAYWHIGGDEVGDKDWDENPAIVAYKAAHGIQSNHDLEAIFTERVRELLAAHQKTLVGWEEILNPAVTGDVVAQSWRGPASLASAARDGHRGILSSGYYLDLMMGADALYAVEPVDASLDPQAAARVLGGEVCMWGELVDAGNVESRIWPSTAAVAERLWSAASLTDTADMYRRLWRVSDELERAGGAHRAGPAAILSSIAGPLEPALAHAVETLAPLPLSPRLSSYPYTTTTPLTRVADAAIADPRAMRELATLVEQATDPAARARLRAAFSRWQNDCDALSGAPDPRLQEIAPLLSSLRELSVAASSALDMLDSGSAPPSGWRAAQEPLLLRGEQPAAELRSLLAPLVRKLLDTVDAQSSESTISTSG
jgi:hexosaminidase